jgi:DNA-directed RNA polymerase subunit F
LRIQELELLDSFAKEIISIKSKKDLAERILKVLPRTSERMRG